MTQSLADLVRQGAFDAGKIFDIGLQLGQYLMDDAYRSAAANFAPIQPEWILLDDDGKPSLTGLNSFSGPLYTVCRETAFHSPAWMLENPVPSLEEDLFSLGMVMGCMMLGKNPYETLPEGVFTARGCSDGPVLHLEANPLCDTDACAAVEGLLDSSPANRLPAFVRMVKFAADRYPGEAAINFTCEGRVVATGTLRFSPDRLSAPLSKSFFVAGVRYETPDMKLEYRPGRHVYTIPVQRQGEGQQREKSTIAVYTNAPDGNPVQAFRIGEGTQQYRTPIRLQKEGYRIVLFRVKDDRQERLQSYTFTVLNDSIRVREGVLTLSVANRPNQPPAIRISLHSADGRRELMADRFIQLPASVL